MSVDLLGSVGEQVIPEEPTALYRLFDAAGNLLYVGISMDIAVRWKHHARLKPWWSEVASATLEHFATRAEAEAAEVAAILAEEPLWNIKHAEASQRPAPVIPKQVTPEVEERWLLPKDAAELLAVSRVTIHKYKRDDLFRVRHYGGQHYRIALSSLKELRQACDMKPSRMRIEALAALADRNREEGLPPAD